MPKIELAGGMYEVDKDGFLQESDRWNEDIARAYAAKDGITELTDDHWKVIRYLRSYYLENGICPTIRHLTRDMDMKLRRIYDLFPEGPGDSACKWAGIPGTSGCH